MIFSQGPIIWRVPNYKKKHRVFLMILPSAGNAFWEPIIRQVFFSQSWISISIWILFLPLVFHTETASSFFSKYFKREPSKRPLKKNLAKVFQQKRAQPRIIGSGNKDLSDGKFLWKSLCFFLQFGMRRIIGSQKAFPADGKIIRKTLCFFL